MGAGLYEAAFATMVRLQGTAARSAITAITLIAGFASTVGWPLSAWMEAQWGWRGACMAWAGLHLLLGLPLNALLPAWRGSLPVMVHGAAAETAARTSAQAHRGVGPTAGLLAVVFAITAFVATAMAAHLPGVIMATGVSPAMALLAGALLGPAQVMARVLEWRVLQRWHPLVAARLAAVLHPVGAVLMGLWAGPWGMVFAFLHGAGNGIMTIAKGALPLALFGPQGYGARQGWLMAPARVAQAAAPWMFGVWLERLGAGVLWVSGGLGVVACLALWAIRPRR
jgi:predicted MFS family arabinose efflux permease